MIFFSKKNFKRKEKKIQFIKTILKFPRIPPICFLLFSTMCALLIYVLITFLHILKWSISTRCRVFASGGNVRDVVMLKSPPLPPPPIFQYFLLDILMLKYMRTYNPGINKKHLWHLYFLLIRSYTFHFCMFFFVFTFSSHVMS